jgi:hypothetical protein
MRQYIDIIESMEIPNYYYYYYYHHHHGSYNKLPVGTILTARNDDYESDWKDTDFY